MVIQNSFPIVTEQPGDIANMKLAPIELAGELRLFLQKPTPSSIALVRKLRLAPQKRSPVIAAHLVIIYV